MGNLYMKTKEEVKLEIEKLYAMVNNESLPAFINIKQILKSLLNMHDDLAVLAICIVALEQQIKYAYTKEEEHG